MDLFDFSDVINMYRWDWYHVKSTISVILGPPDVLRVKCTSSSSTPASLSPGVPWLDLIGDTCLACHTLPQAVMLFAVSFSCCFMPFNVV